jgi:hypothetical protein
MVESIFFYWGNGLTESCSSLIGYVTEEDKQACTFQIYQEKDEIQTSLGQQQ